MEQALDILSDAFLDTVYLVPFLFVTYLLMEILEHKTGNKTQEMVKRAGVAGPAIGAVLGAVPQCGFSAAAATLYSGRVVSLGTLYAVLLSTSDEMLPVFIAEQAPIGLIATILISKIIIGMLFGFIVDLIYRTRHAQGESLRIHEICEREHCACHEGCDTCEHNPELVYSHHDDCADGCDHHHHEHDHSHEHGAADIAKSALVHTVQVTVFILIISLALNVVLAFVGEDALASALSGNEVLSVVCAALVGLIPNCAASVVIAQLFLDGVIEFGAMMAGLLVSAGVGILVLLRTNRPVKQSIFILLGLLAFGIVSGLIISLS